MRLAETLDAILSAVPRPDDPVTDPAWRRWQNGGCKGSPPAGPAYVECVHCGAACFRPHLAGCPDGHNPWPYCPECGAKRGARHGHGCKRSRRPA